MIARTVSLPPRPASETGTRSGGTYALVTRRIVSTSVVDQSPYAARRGQDVVVPAGRQRTARADADGCLTVEPDEQRGEEGQRALPPRPGGGAWPFGEGPSWDRERRGGWRNPATTGPRGRASTIAR